MHFYALRVSHRSESSAIPLPFLVSRRDQQQTRAVKTNASSFSRSVPQKFVTGCHMSVVYLFLTFMTGLLFPTNIRPEKSARLAPKLDQLGRNTRKIRCDSCRLGQARHRQGSIPRSANERCRPAGALRTDRVPYVRRH